MNSGWLKTYTSIMVVRISSSEFKFLEWFITIIFSTYNPTRQISQSHPSKCKIPSSYFKCFLTREEFVFEPWSTKAVAVGPCHWGQQSSTKWGGAWWEDEAKSVSASLCSLGSVLHLLLLLGLLLLKASPSFSGLFSLVPKQLKLVSYGVSALASAYSPRTCSITL